MVRTLVNATMYLQYTNNTIFKKERATERKF
jgi:hypothetical protein